ncbi:catechol 1,2-dioxygenase-like [Paramacrobiotus metropolitanus]|uniref:catechol 1,2-dioxygenase-like n=1 Tax=Paramacrobiotus metropolitanus TaxID=2943436 RepID=UPI002445EB88|nr:catechol 1,2-dioxygenase-like [Paramacrobiotus metropolitanus]
MRYLLVVFLGVVTAQRPAPGSFPCEPRLMRATGTDMEGPYYKPNSPFGRGSGNQPTVCSENLPGTRLYLNGTVMKVTPDQPCGSPIRALLDVWSADVNGAYSNIAPESPDFTCRSRFTTDERGNYAFSSILPGRYYDSGWRPAHVHWKITPIDANGQPVGRTITTQMYFVGDQYRAPNDSCEACNSGDSSMVTHVTQIPGGGTAGRCRLLAYRPQRMRRLIST